MGAPIVGAPIQTEHMTTLRDGTARLAILINSQSLRNDFFAELELAELAELEPGPRKAEKCIFWPILANFDPILAPDRLCWPPGGRKGRFSREKKDTHDSIRFH